MLKPSPLSHAYCYIQVSVVRDKSHVQSMTSITCYDPMPDTVNQLDMGLVNCHIVAVQYLILQTQAQS